MPIYEYSCEKCKGSFEEMYSSVGSGSDVLGCAYDCGGKAHRVMSATSSLTGKSGRSGSSSKLGDVCDSCSEEERVLLVIPVVRVDDGKPDN